MMRRVIALLQAVWLALLIAEPAALHACEMHASGHSTHDAPVVAGASVHHSGHEHAIHDDASAVPEDAGAAVCQCLGSCCAAATAALVPTP
ncbi:MAG TPA: hypothetical protein PK788_13140, partial [Gemmatimonadaceae bacterium]|nr:hypothetical protein [Gemmatimonadaceae bacterium]